MTGWMKGDPSIVQLHLFSVGTDKISMSPNRLFMTGALGGVAIIAFGTPASVVAMSMGDASEVDGTPWVDEEVACGTIDGSAR